MPTERRRGPAARLLLVLLALAAPALMAAPARAADTRHTCEVGMLLSDLYALDPAHDSFSAKFDLWSTCPSRPGPDPIAEPEFTDAIRVRVDVSDTRTVAGRRWTITTFNGTFHHDWDTSAFPFDRHRLTISFHPTALPSASSFTVDRTGSHALSTLDPGDYSVTAFGVAPSLTRYPGGLGAPGRGGPDTAYPGLTATVDLRRSGYIGFLTLITPLYISVAVTAITFLMTSRDSDVMLARLGLAGSGLFAVVINMQSTHTDLGLTTLALIDLLHLAGLAFVLVAVAATVVCWHRLVRMQHVLRLKQLNRRVAFVALLAYGTTNVVLLTRDWFPS
ncbi:hypothetical protein ABT160_42205 [Streptomyces sp. NPDC001941]|uniref:hypothetical protein n=1 Tax=Streptomyces sp. NPDC001941 TaxID=3154659 RepID=UPI00331679D8